RSPHEICFLVHREAEDFHQLRQRFTSVEIQNDVADRRFDVVLRLSQCWTMELWRELHSWGRTVACAILDCIGIDTGIDDEGPLNAFQFGAEHADGLIFNSHHTKQLFTARFRPAARVQLDVYYHSFDLNEYRTEKDINIANQRDSIL